MKKVCVERQGGFGDMLQAAVTFPALKAQGFSVTVMTSPKGKDILKHDPNVDDWIINEPDAIPNEQLMGYWAEQAKSFDRFVILSGSIEGSLLALPGHPNHTWPYDVRKRRMNINYHEWTAELASVPFKPCRLFYPSEEEIEDVAAALNPEQFNVVWALAGSSLHKASPHIDAVIARMMMEMPEAKIYLVGDDFCKLLEQGWESEKRVVCASGKLNIRRTLTLAMYSNLVIGPETGVLNAVGMEKAPSKVLMLSHSSEHNLSKHWVSTQTLKPKNCACFPCHRLHYNMEFCDEDKVTGAARCAVNIDAAMIYEAVEKVYKKWRRK